MYGVVYGLASVLCFSGPGEYAPEGSQMLGKGKAGLLCCHEQRFMPVKSTVPGPGSYEVTTVYFVATCILHVCE